MRELEYAKANPAQLPNLVFNCLVALEKKLKLHQTTGHQFKKKNLIFRSDVTEDPLIAITKTKKF